MHFISSAWQSIRKRFPTRFPAGSRKGRSAKSIWRQDTPRLQQQIINYSKTRPIYEEYRKAGYSKKFLEAHREEITLHKAAKAAFDELGVRKLPKVKELSKEYAEIFSAKKRTYREYYHLKKEVNELVIAQQNINSLYDAERKEKDQLHQKEEQIH